MVIFFRDKSIGAIFFLVVLCVLVHYRFFIVPPQVAISVDDGVLSIVLRKCFAGLSGTILVVLYYALILLQAIRLNFILDEFRMFQRTAFTTAFSYILLSSIIPQWSNLTPALVANSLVIWIFLKLSRLYNNPSPKTLLFNTGLIVGLTVLAYHPTAILVLVVLFALAILRPFRLAEWLVLVIGIITPYYFLVSILFLKDKLYLLHRFLPEPHFNTSFHHPDTWFWLSLSVVLLLVLVSFYYWLPNNNRMIIQIRKNWAVMIVMLLILLTVPFIFKNAGIESAVMILVPLAAFVSNAFLYPRRLLLPTVLFAAALVIVLHNNWTFIKN